MKIAIIGSGIAGLAAAWRLNRNDQFRVTLIERQSRIGMDSHCLEIPDGRDVLVADVPSRMFNAHLWPELTRLYDELGVVQERVHPTQSFSRLGDDDGGADNYLRLKVAYQPKMKLRYWLNRDTRNIFQDARRLMVQGRAELENHAVDRAETLRGYLDRNRYSDAFIKGFLYPTLSSTVCTCSYDSLDRYPAVVILSALSKLTGDAPLRRVRGGVNVVVEKLLVGLKDIRVGANVRRVQHVDDSVQVDIDGHASEAFDHVIVATQANTAISLAPSIADAECQILNAIRYEDISVVVHCDQRFMPRRRSDWATFNMMTDDTATGAMCTVWMNEFHREWNTKRNVFQTISPIGNRSPAGVIANVVLQRPVVDHDSADAVSRLDEIQHELNRRIWFAGSWAAPGIPLLETGVVSAARCIHSIEQTYNKIGSTARM